MNVYLRNIGDPELRRVTWEDYLGLLQLAFHDGWRTPRLERAYAGEGWDSLFHDYLPDSTVNRVDAHALYVALKPYRWAKNLPAARASLVTLLRVCRGGAFLVRAMRL